MCFEAQVGAGPKTVEVSRIAGSLKEPRAGGKKRYFFLVVFFVVAFLAVDFLAAAFFAMALFLLSVATNVKLVKIRVNDFF